MHEVMASLSRVTRQWVLSMSTKLTHSTPIHAQVGRWAKIARANTATQVRLQANQALLWRGMSSMSPNR